MNISTSFLYPAENITYASPPEVVIATGHNGVASSALTLDRFDEHAEQEQQRLIQVLFVLLHYTIVLPLFLLCWLTIKSALHRSGLLSLRRASTTDRIPNIEEGAAIHQSINIPAVEGLFSDPMKTAAAATSSVLIPMIMLNDEKDGKS